jgi:DNA polymerase-3 subunit alpha
MTLDLGNTDKLLMFRREAQRMGVRIAPPSVNASGVEFDVDDGVILYSLAGLKNVGRGAIEHLVAVREEGGRFTSLGDFARRVDGRVINKRALESMAKAGAFDVINPNRHQVLSGVESILAMASRTSDEKAQGQNDLFGGAGAAEEDVPLPYAEGWLPMQKLGAEFEAVGFYLSGHPLDDFVKPLSRIGVETWASFYNKAQTRGARAARLAGTVTAKQERRSKNGNKFAFVSFSDPTGQFEAIVFADTLANVRELLEPGSAVILSVEADVEGEEVKLRLQGVEPVDKAVANIQEGIKIFLRDASPIESIAKRLTNGGRAPVHIVVMEPSGREIEIALGNKFTVTPQVKGAIKAVAGVVDVQDY